MFTGIVTALGTVRSITPLGGNADMRLNIETPWPNTSSIVVGASISCSGCCLTAVEIGPDWFAADASAETLSRTTLGRWRAGTSVNLERSLCVGDELGGHLVSGHVDGLGEALSSNPEHGSTRWMFRVPHQSVSSVSDMIGHIGRQHRSFPVAKIYKSGRGEWI